MGPSLALACTGWPFSPGQQKPSNFKQCLAELEQVASQWLPLPSDHHMALRVSATPCLVPWGLSEADSAESCFSGQPSNSHLGCIVVVMGSWGQSLQEVLFRKQAELRRSRFGPLEPFHTTPLQLFLQTSGQRGRTTPQSRAKFIPPIVWQKETGSSQGFLGEGLRLCV